MRKLLTGAFALLLCSGCASMNHTHPLHSHDHEHHRDEKVVTECSYECLVDRTICSVATSLLNVVFDIEEGKTSEEKLAGKELMEVLDRGPTRDDIPFFVSLVPSVKDAEIPLHCDVTYDACVVNCWLTEFGR